MENLEKKKTLRPRQHDLDEKLYYFKKLSEGNPSDGVEPGDFKANLDELTEFSQNKGEAETREEWYPGWTQEDFNKLLQMLEEEGLIDSK